MNIDRYLQISKEIEQREKDVEESKRQSYTVGNVNVLANFQDQAKVAGITPMQNWLTHYLKQHAAILSYILHPDVEPSEPLVSRVGDLRTYLKLLVAIAEDEGRDTGLVPAECVDWAREEASVKFIATHPEDQELADTLTSFATWANKMQLGFAGIREKLSRHPEASWWEQDPEPALTPQDNALDPRYNPRSK